MNRLAIATVLAAASLVIAAPAFADHHEEKDGCDHGATSKACRPDPQPTHGKDCQKHGNHGGINEDHCGPASSPSPTSTGGTPSPTTIPSTTTSTTTSSTSTTSTCSTTTTATPSTTTPTTPTSPPSTRPSTQPKPSSKPPKPASTTPSTTAPPELALTGGELSDGAAVALFVTFVGAIVGGFGWLISRKPKDPS